MTLKKILIVSGTHGNEINPVWAVKQFCNQEDISNNNIKYKINYNDKNDLFNLNKWEEYEKSNPRIFAGMYQFWCKK